jgi:hypothetical protein
MESLKQWLEETLVKLSQKSLTTKAIRYALGRSFRHVVVISTRPSSQKRINASRREAFP